MRFLIVPRPMASSGRAVLDPVERLVVLFLFMTFAGRMASRHQELLQSAPWSTLGGLSTILGAALLVTSEGLAVCLMLIRPFGQPISQRPLDWLLGFAGSAAPLLAHPAAAGGVPVWLADTVMLAGLVLQIAAKAALWTSFGVVPALRPAKCNGPYRLIRHPMYLGYSLTYLGFLIGYPSLYNTALYGSVLLINVSRLLREEEFLVKDPMYFTYSQRVRYRLLPKIF